MTASGNSRNLIKWQKPMTRVLWALAPVCVGAIFFFGWRFLIVLAIVNAAGFFCEWMFCRHYRESVSSAIFVTNTLFALIIPPTLPIWMAVVGVSFGVIFGKMVFGGFGKNIFNPAMVGRAFIYINFAMPMTSKWVAPFDGGTGGFIHYAADTVSGATPMQVLTHGGEIAISKLFLGQISGCYGETSALLILIGGLYLVWTKTANRLIVVSCFAGFILIQGALWLTHAGGAFDPLRALLSGGFMLGAFFMATDPVSACQTNEGKIIYGFLIGALTVVIRVFSVWAEGMMFAILLANMFGPIIDIAVREIKSR